MYRKFVWCGVLVAAFLAFSGEAQGKYRGFAEEVFFGRHAGAAGSATGRTGVTSSGKIIDAFYNPAGLADAKGLGLCISWSDPYYWLEEAEYRYIGGNIRLGDLGTLGVSRYRLDYGSTAWAQGAGQSQGGSAEASILTITLAEEIGKDLLVGMNISAFEYQFPTGMGRSMDEARSFWADVGLMKYFNLARTRAAGHWLRLGGSLSNLTYSRIEVLGDYNDLPTALRLGAAYEMGWWGMTWEKGLRTVETKVDVEYQNILNYEHRTALRLGGEVRLIEILALRLGYYWETVDDHGQDSNEDSIDKTTYGFGLNLPLHKIGGGKLPLGLGLDYANMKQPEYTKSGETDNFTILTIFASYYF